jgi:hypothetical protein
MKTYLFALLITLPMMANLGYAAVNDPRPDETGELKEEIDRMLRSKDLSVLKAPTEEAKVIFLINARNELVILDVISDNDALCDMIRNTLSFKKVRYHQPKQLTSYMVTVRMVKKE